MTLTNFSIYDASAGSGKTYTLAKEYLKIILTASNNEAYKKILAITFTNKAVKEMKDRIIFNLSEFTNDELSDKSLELITLISKETSLSIPEIKEKSKKIIKNIIHNYASFDISTIDKFTHRIIRTFAIDLGLPATFEVSLEQKAIVQEAIDRIIAKAGNDEELTKVLVDFALSKTDEDKSWDISADLNAIAEILDKENNRIELENIKEISIKDFQDIKKKLQKISTNIHDYLTTISLNILQYIEDQNFNPKAFTRNTFPNHIIKISKGDFDVENIYTTPESIESKVSVKCKDDIYPHIPFFLEQLEQIYKWKGRWLMYNAVIKNITPLSLLNSISNEIKLVQKEKNILSIAEFNKIIFEKIQHQPSPFIYERLGDRYKHFFIDEFQDTSEMQWQNLIPLVDNALSGIDESGNVGTLMIVGDPKQSIYRWRGGKAEQFINLSKINGENPFSNPNKNIIRLEKNFRSFSEVILFNNTFFEFVATKFNTPDYENLYAKNSSQEINSKIGGFVSIDFLPNVKDLDLIEDESELSKADLYLSKTIEIINNLLENGFTLSEIVLLVRKKIHGVLLANFLTENKIPIISSETLLISNSDDVNFILDLLAILKNFNDKESKVSILYYIAKNIIPGVQVHDFISEGINQTSETDFEYYIHQNTSVNFKLEEYRRKPLYEICESIIKDFIPNKASIAYVHYFLDIVLERDMKMQLSLSEFLEYWNKNKSNFSIPSPEGVDAVQIMTIHKSKGLEFPIVIYPFAEEDISKIKSDKMWLTLEIDEDIALKKSLVSNSKNVQQYSIEAADLYHTSNEQKMLDLINVLYVALTRAEEQLYIITSRNETSTGLSNNLSSFFVEFLIHLNLYSSDRDSYTFGNINKTSKTHKNEENANYIPNVVSGNLKSSAVKIVMKDAVMWGSFRASAIEFGNLVHELLSYIKYPEDIDSALEMGMHSGKLFKEYYEPVKYILENVVNHQDLNAHFNTNAKVYNEQAIIKLNSSTIKPDRVTIYKRKATLLEYKTGSFNEAHINQINDYELALREMGYEVIKKSLLYIGDTIEIVNL